MTEKIKKDMIDGNIVNSIVSSQVDLSDPENPILPEFVLKSVYDLAMINKADIDGGGTTGGVWFQDAILSDLFPNYKQVIRVLGGQMAIEYGNVELDVHRFVVTSVSGLKVKVGSAEYTVFHSGNFNPDSKANTDGSNATGALAATIGNNHNHANKSVLDSITAQDLIDWDNASAQSHNALTLGANAAGIDLNTATQRLQFQNGYQLPTTIKLGEYDEAFLMRHSHTNKNVLDNLTQAVIDNSHTHGNKALLDSYNQTNADIAAAVSLRHNHINKAILDAITAAYTTADKNTLDALAGIQLEADQANALIHIKDGNGNVLSTLNVAFLNNEGTTFVYNPTTNTLDLINDYGQTLSSIPVSSFVTNLVNNANWNGSTPSRLDFKDNAGTILFSIDYSIANIQGLQTALDVLTNNIGNLPSLTTTHKTTIVGAINEVNSKSFSQAKQLRTYYLKTASYNTARKLRLYFNEGFGGTLKLEITGGYSAGNTNGEIILQGGLGVNVGSFLWNEALNCTNSRGVIRNWIYINPTVLFDSANGRAYIEINKKIAADNDYTLKITLLSIHADLTTMEPYLVDMGTANVENGANNVFFEGKITVSGGNSDQWDLAFARGDFRDYGLGVITAPLVTNDTNGLPNGFYRAHSGAIIAAIGGAYSSVYHSDWGGGYSQDLIIGDNGRIAVGFSSPGNPTYQIKEIFTGSNFNPNNFIPTSHPSYSITQQNINNWLGYYGYWDNRQIRPSDINIFKMQFGFGSWNNNNVAEWADYLHFGGYGDGSGGNQNLIMFKKNGFGLRQFQGTSQSPSVYQSFVDYFHTGNFNPDDKADVTYVDAKVAAIPTHNGQLTVNTTADLVGGYVYLPSGNLTTTLGLATHVLNAIADGQAAYNFGNHATQGYLKIADLAPYETTVSVNNKLTAKQDKLIAGANVSIVGNTISATDTNTITRIGVWGGNYTSGDINFTATGAATIVKNGNNINIDVTNSGGIPNQGVEVLDFTPGSYSIDTNLSTTIVRCTAGGSMYSFDVKKGKYDGDELCFTSCGYEYQVHGEILTVCSTGLTGGSNATRFIWSDQLTIWVQVS